MRTPIPFCQLLAAAGLLGCTPSSTPAAPMPPTAAPASGAAAANAPAKVTGAEARALVAAGATLVDVRTPAEFAGGHLDGARNIPVGELQGRLAELPKDKPVVVYCAAGARSAAAAAALADAGYQARNLGAMANW